MSMDMEGVIWIKNLRKGNDKWIGKYYTEFSTKFRDVNELKCASADIERYRL